MLGLLNVIGEAVLIMALSPKFPGQRIAESITEVLDRPISIIGELVILSSIEVGQVTLYIRRTANNV